MTEPARTNRPWLRADSLTFSHGARRAVDSVSLDFYPGRHYVIAGPNGAGKSTLLDLLAGLKQAEFGKVEVMGAPLASYGPRRLAKQLALAPQEFSLHFSFTVREVVG
ncbi:MAG: ATP-binding cassette domain-containing protein, partial [Planctomycetes bacterium]|nr:ATP-binding cassette domain-containing protein [Planctomycetota bacterium]